MYLPNLLNCLKVLRYLLITYARVKTKYINILIWVVFSKKKGLNSNWPCAILYLQRSYLYTNIFLSLYYSLHIYHNHNFIKISWLSLN